MEYKKYLHHILQFIIIPIKKLPEFFVFMYLLGLICFITESPLPDGYSFYEDAYIELFLYIYVLGWLLCYMPKRLRFWLKGVIYAISYSATIIDVYCYTFFNTLFTPAIMQIMLETNTGEASEFLREYLSPAILLSNVGFIIILMLAHLSWSAFLKKRIHFNIETLKRIVIFDKYAKPACSVTTLLLVIMACKPMIENNRKILAITSQNDIGRIENMNHDYAQGMFLPIHRIYYSICSNIATSKRINDMVHSIDSIQVDSCSFRSPNIILIIGESYNKHHSELYGYPLHTTPHQSQWARSGHLNVFTNVVTTWNLTSFVFKNFMSMHAVDEEGSWCDQPLFTELFHQSGYHVTFLTNQFVQQPDNEIFDFSGGYFLNNERLSEAQFDSRNTQTYRFDEGLLDCYDSIKTENTSHNLIIFHLIGQHVEYRERYPHGQHYFNYKHYEGQNLSKREKTRKSDYDNATHYNDSIVDQIIRRFENQNAIVIYMPDHGEEVYDDSRKEFGRDHSPHLTPEIARYEYEIPFWIWYSDKYLSARPDIVNLIKHSLHRPFMNDNLPHLLLYLAGISCPNYKEQNNLISPRYNSSRRRLLRGAIDYDSLMQTEND